MSGCISAIVCSPDNKFLYITNDEGNMKKIDVGKKLCVGFFESIMGNWINSLCMNGKGDRIWFTDCDGMMKNWDTEKQTVVNDYKKVHKRTIHSVCFVEGI